MTAIYLYYFGGLAAAVAEPFAGRWMPLLPNDDPEEFASEERSLPRRGPPRRSDLGGVAGRPHGPADPRGGCRGWVSIDGVYHRRCGCERCKRCGLIGKPR